ncbi:MAG: DUF2784 domain-containing protein [Verrucomicrobia bacterium]|nr:DUF2784 domain-containing protein [Verrucomicrobiota bacterium]
MTRFYSSLADAVLVVHFAYVAFVVVGLLMIWVGYFLRWSFVRNFWFRLAHLCCMGVVVMESVFGMTCPLTTWEMKLRLLASSGQYYQGSFIQHWVHRVLFYSASEGVFLAIYGSFFVLLLLSLWIVKPRWPGHRKS